MGRFRLLLPLVALGVVASLIPLEVASAADTAQILSYPSQFATSCSSRAYPAPGSVGQATLSRVNNVVSLYVEFQGAPSTTYRVALACIADLGEITTDSNGAASGQFQHTVNQNQAYFSVALRTVTASANFLAIQKDIYLPYTGSNPGK